ncbi:uncharacterized protein SPPG_09244 [Spizellomyces punctatus DAOM BR117]|uniref:Uncharacterized protein n=1 Tax=Spizellomyces punctatus (strain DAOM BR117) TaxID=645134 RepID=A0A0L0HF49_SPIPD|nr:uncharacterized protein SPPG_09244 [Spizellomyces punctatus DAOM BR117]KNC99661.1 hypothetical protein SPPG_09244 [Spizellomyces punctatus DAOM BR117]|eukprot:XP_016607701.1 hypothetical protein SPPG_09244 [Spizellomyces punctatus DAOM BR117]
MSMGAILPAKWKECKSSQKGRTESVIGLKDFCSRIDKRQFRNTAQRAQKSLVTTRVPRSKFEKSTLSYDYYVYPFLSHPDLVTMRRVYKAVISNTIPVLAREIA